MKAWLVLAVVTAGMLFFAPGFPLGWFLLFLLLNKPVVYVLEWMTKNAPDMPKG